MTQPTSKRLITEATAAATYATLAMKFRGSSRIRATAATPPYAAPVAATPPTVTHASGAAAANTKTIAPDSAVFRWSGPTRPTGFGSMVQRGRTLLDGTTAPGTAWSTIAFDFDGDTFDIFFDRSASAVYRIWVNEQASSAAMAAMPGASGFGCYHVDFGSASIGNPRRIVIEVEDSAAPLQFYGIYTKPVHTVTFPALTSPRVMIIGDSYGEGRVANYFAEAYSKSLGRLLGFADTWSHFTSCSSTGLVKAADASSGNYGSRLAGDVIPYSPDVVIIQGSLNDSGLSGVDTALTSYINTLHAALPKCIVIVTGPLYVATPNDGYLAVRDTMRAVCATMGVPFVDIFSPNTYFTGYSGSPGSGNVDNYLGSDGIHPTKEGHFFLAKVLAGLIGPSLGQYE